MQSNMKNRLHILSSRLRRDRGGVFNCLKVLQFHKYFVFQFAKPRGFEVVLFERIIEVKRERFQISHLEGAVSVCARGLGRCTGQCGRTSSMAIGSGSRNERVLELVGIGWGIVEWGLRGRLSARRGELNDFLIAFSFNHLFHDSLDVAFCEIGVLEIEYRGGLKVRHDEEVEIRLLR